MELRMEFKYPEGFISYSMEHNRPVIVKAVGYIGIGPLLDNFRSALPLNTSDRENIVEAIKDTTQRIFLLFIYGGIVTSAGKVFLPQDVRELSKPIIKSRSYYKVSGHTAENLQYELGTNRNQGPSFYIGSQPLRVDYYLHSTYETALSPHKQTDRVRLPIASIKHQALMTIAHTYGRGRAERTSQ